MALIRFGLAFALLFSADTVAAADPPRREIRFAVAAQFPPFQSRDPQGQLVGLHIELGNALCQQLNVRCTWVDQVLVEDFAALEARQFDAIMGMAPTSERRRRVNFTDHLYPFTTRLVARRTSGLLPTVRSLKGKRVGVLLGSNREAFARAQWAPAGVLIKAFWLNDELVRSLVAGDIDATLQALWKSAELCSTPSTARALPFWARYCLPNCWATAPRLPCASPIRHCATTSTRRWPR